MLGSYDEERTFGADENIRNSARATNFMTPKSAMERIFRDAVLDLAKSENFARKLVNSGRLSLPCSLHGLSLQREDEDAMIGRACPDAPLQQDGRARWLLEHLQQCDVNACKLLLPDDWDCPAVPGVAVIRISNAGSLYQQRFGEVATLLRPDQHVLARFTTPAELAKNLRRAIQTLQGHLS